MNIDGKQFTDKMIKFIQQQSECRKFIEKILNAVSNSADMLMDKIKDEFEKFNIIDVDVEIRPTINKTKTAFENSAQDLGLLSELDTYTVFAHSTVSERFISFRSYVIITIRTDLKYKPGADFKKLPYLRITYIEPYLESLAKSIKTISYTRGLVTHDSGKSDGIDFNMLIATTPNWIAKADMEKAGVF